MAESIEEFEPNSQNLQEILNYIDKEKEKNNNEVPESIIINNTDEFFENKLDNFEFEPIILENYNLKLYKEGKKIKNFIEIAKKWLNIKKDNLDSIEKLDKLETAIVKKMNKWFGKINAGFSDLRIACRIVKKNCFDFEFKTINGFKEFLSAYSIPTYNKEDYAKIKNYEKNRTDYLSNAEINPLPICKKIKLNNGETQNKFIIRIEKKSIANIWLEHKHSASYERVVMNPRPSYFVNAARKNELNQWGGYYLHREAVKEYTDWSILVRLFNHINYTWCDNEQEFCYILAKMAIKLQKPWLKTGVCIGLGGDEGTGKTLIIDEFYGRIIGPVHYLHTQDTRDVIGEFNALLANKMVIFLDESRLGVGSKNQEDDGIFKNMVTGTTQRVRSMRKNPTYEESYADFYIASNHYDNLVMASEKSRRYVLFHSYLEPLLNHPLYKKVSKGANSIYFEQLTNSMLADGMKGLKTFANFLYNIPIDNFQYNSVIGTALLAKHIVKNLNCVKLFWIECIREKANVFPKEANSKWLNKFGPLQLFEKFKRSEYYNKLYDDSFSEIIRSMLPKQTKLQFFESLGVYEFELPGNNEESYNNCYTTLITQIAGIDHFLKNKTIPLTSTKIERLQKVTEEDLLFKFIPENFYGYELRKEIEENKFTFKIRTMEEWRPTDDENPDNKHFEDTLIKEMNEIKQKKQKELDEINKMEYEKKRKWEEEHQEEIREKTLEEQKKEEYQLQMEMEKAIYLPFAFNCGAAIVNCSKCARKIVSYHFQNNFAYYKCWDCNLTYKLDMM